MWVCASARAGVYPHKAGTRLKSAKQGHTDEGTGDIDEGARGSERERTAAKNGRPAAKPCIIPGSTTTNMCYVIYTGAGREKTAQRMILKLVPRELFTRVFYPFRHMRKKIGGNWADIYEWLIPGYLFVITDRPAELYTALRRVPRLTKLLGRIGDNSPYEFLPVAPEEETWLRALLGDNWFDPASQLPADAANPTGPDADNDPAALAALSMIDFDEHDRVRILSGPLMTFSAQVRRIDLHRRFAEVEVNFMGHPQLLRLGLEILTKVT